jgi:hypothetical protein
LLIARLVKIYGRRRTLLLLIEESEEINTVDNTRVLWVQTGEGRWADTISQGVMNIGYPLRAVTWLLGRWGVVDNTPHQVRVVVARRELIDVKGEGARLDWVARFAEGMQGMCP